MLCRALRVEFFKKPLDTLGEWTKAYQELRKWFFEEATWFEVYDFVEFVSVSYPDEDRNDSFRELCNHVLEDEKSGFRFLGSLLARITSEQEIATVREAIESDDPASVHIAQAVGLFSRRSDPDFRNSIKESISAVESIVRLSTGGARGNMVPLLTRLEKEAGLHPALSKAFSVLFGYTSDASGIRHALLDKATVDFDEAKFMLVACSAFVNYARVKLSAMKSTSGEL